MAQMAKGLGTERGEDRVDERIPERLVRPSSLDNDDRFEIDWSKCPRGYTMEFKRVTLFGLNDRRNQIISHRNHWRPVPHKLQPHFLGHLESNGDAPIIVDGLQLMMRPSYLNDDANKEHIAATNYVLGEQLKALRGSSKAQVGPQNTKIERQMIVPSSGPQQIVE